MSQITADSIEHCFQSANVADSNGETANIVDVIHDVGQSLWALRNAVCHPAAPWNTDTGGQVGNLTEAMVYIGQQLGRIADTIGDLKRD